MTIAPADIRLRVPLQAPPPGWAADAVDVLERRDVLLLKVGDLRLDADGSFEVARRCVEALRDELVRRGAPSRLGIEIDGVDDTVVAPRQRARNRLPHTDGQHATYLTPSRIDAAFPALDELRRTCRCGACAGESERLFCHGIAAALGIGYGDFRRRYEVWVSSERYDLLL